MAWMRRRKVSRDATVPGAVRPGDSSGYPDRADQPTPVQPVAQTEQVEEVDYVQRHWNLGTVLVALSGAALMALGIVALTRTGVNDTWYTPVVQVGGIDHTQLLAAIEVGTGALLLVLGLAAARILCALVCLAGSAASAAAAINPDSVHGQLAIQRWWAVVLAVAGLVLALLSLLPPGTKAVRRSHRTVRTTSGRAVPQH